MALIRCKEEHNEPVGTKRKYVKGVEPLNYPETAVICGNPKCNNVGIVWLDDDEYKAYMGGERIFQPIGHSVKIKIK